MAEKLKKGQRLQLFYDELAKEAQPRSVVESRNMMAEVMKRIESKHAPGDSDPMTIPELSHWTVAKYGQDGAYIPLINGEIHINANGAAGFHDSRMGQYAFVMSSADGADFAPEVGYRYSYEDAQARHKAVTVTASTDVTDTASSEAPCEVADTTSRTESETSPTAKKVGLWQRIVGLFN